MELKTIDKGLTVSPQITAADVADQEGRLPVHHLQPAGRRRRGPADVCRNREGRQEGRPRNPLPAGRVGQGSGRRRREIRRSSAELPKPVLAYCRTGTRSATLWSLDQGAKGTPLPDILAATRQAGYDMTGVVRRIANGGKTPTDVGDAAFDIVIVGAGPAASRSPPACWPACPSRHRDHRPGRHPLLPAGLDDGRRRHFRTATPPRPWASLIPQGVHWIKAAVSAFEPKDNAVILDGCRVVKYKRLIVCPGPEAQLERHRGAGRDARPERRHLELPLRPRALHLETGAGLKSGPGAVHPAADADQVRRRAAKGDCICRPITGPVKAF
jgi:sulfide:quinone oxidoreductase